MTCISSKSVVNIVNMKQRRLVRVRFGALFTPFRDIYFRVNLDFDISACINKQKYEGEYLIKNAKKSKSMLNFFFLKIRMLPMRFNLN